MVGQADGNSGEGVGEILDAAQPHLCVGRGVHARAVEKGERRAVTANDLHRLPNRADVVHAGRYDHRLAPARDMVDQRVVIALARSDLEGWHIHRVKAVRRLPRKGGGEVSDALGGTMPLNLAFLRLVQLAALNNVPQLLGGGFTSEKI